MGRLMVSPICPDQVVTHQPGRSVSHSFSSLDCTNAGGSCVQPFGFLGAAGLSIEFSQVLKARGHIGMVRAKGLLRDRQRALVERLGLRVLALGAVEQCEVVQARGDIGMVRAKGLLRDRQRALVERLGLRVLALGVVERCEVVQARGDIGMVRAEGLLIDRQRALVERLGLRVLALVR